MTRRLINSLHHLFAKSTTVVRFFLLLRNQCNCIIGYYIAGSSNAEKNGENFIVDNIGANCSVVMDVGANKGNWTKYFLKTNNKATMILLEPSLTASDFLQKKFQSLKNIIIINKAAADRIGETYFFEESNYGETSSIIPDFSKGDSLKKLIKLTTIDALLNELKIENIDYLKIDAEGYDLLVLKGAKNALKEKRIKFIQFEYNAPWAFANSTLINAFELLKEHNYQTYLLKSDGLYSFRYNRYGEFYRYANFFAVSAESADLIQELIKGTI